MDKVYSYTDKNNYLFSLNVDSGVLKSVFVKDPKGELLYFHRLQEFFPVETEDGEEQKLVIE